MTKNKNLTIALLTIFTMIIAFGISYSISQIDLSEEELFFSSVSSLPNKIFIIGSSQVARLNSTVVEQNLDNKLDVGYNVYNLAKNSDHPSKRFSEIEKIISTKPEVVIYGISFRDVGFRPTDTTVQTTIQRTESTTNLAGKNFPTIYAEIIYPNKLSKKFLTNISETIDMKNPKVQTIKILNELSQEEEHNQKLPFYKIPNPANNIMSDNGLKKNSLNLEYIENAGLNTEREYNSIKSIIQKLQNNQIKVILVLLPQHEYYVNIIPTTTQNKFYSLIGEIENEFEVDVYDIVSKYQDQNIWSNLDHLTMNTNSNFVSDEFADFLSDRL